MRIAICLSGQPRTWNYCYKTWFNLISKIKEISNVDVDVFCHVWNFNTPSHDILIQKSLKNEIYNNDFQSIEVNNISDDEKIKFIKLLNPKSYIFENEEISKSKLNELEIEGMKYFNNHGGTAISWAGSQFYSIMRSCHLKKKYEIDNGFRYDICFRMRYDLFFDDEQIDFFSNIDFKIPKYNTLYTCHTRKIGVMQFPFYEIGDIFWYSDSLTFDRICDFYRWLPIIGKNSFNKSLEISTEQCLYFYCKMLRMEIKPLLIDPKIYRDENHLIDKEDVGMKGELKKNEII